LVETRSDGRIKIPLGREGRGLTGNVKKYEIGTISLKEGREQSENNFAKQQRARFPRKNPQRLVEQGEAGGTTPNLSGEQKLQIYEKDERKKMRIRKMVQGRCPPKT